MRDNWLGLLLLATFGTETVCLRGTLSSVSGTFVVGETVTGGTSGATGTVKILDGTTRMYVAVVSGTFTSGETITGGTSSATAAFAYDTGVRAHVFERLNSNAHPSLTVYKVDDVDTMRAAYCMVNSLDIEAVVGDFVKFMLEMEGKGMTSTTGTPSYDEQNAFLAKHATLKLASSLAGLSAASASAVSRTLISVAKNLTDYQAFGDDDVAAFYNQQFGVTGELEALLTLQHFGIT